jgi:hypothetical protein
VDALNMFIWILVVSSLGLVMRSFALRSTVKHLQQTIELKDSRIKKLSEQLNMFGGGVNI